MDEKHCGIDYSHDYIRFHYYILYVHYTFI